MYKYILCMTKERKKKKKRLIRTRFALFSHLGFKYFFFSKMLHFIRDATFHLHWRSFREKVSLTESHTITHSFVFITNGTLLLQHASDIFIFLFRNSIDGKRYQRWIGYQIRRVKSSFHVHSTKAMCDDWKISTEARNGILSLQKLKISRSVKLYR